MPTLARLGLELVLAGSHLPGDDAAPVDAMARPRRVRHNSRDELSVLPVVFRQAQALTTLGTRPLVVLTTAENHDTDGWTAAQDRMAALSTDTARPSRPATPAWWRTPTAPRPRSTPSPPSSTPSAPGPPSPPPDHPVCRKHLQTHLRSTHVPRTRPPPHIDTEELQEPRKSWALLGIALAAQILVVLDISVVNTALPTIGRSLHLDGNDLQWLVTAYVMMSGGGLLLGGRVSDLLSRRGVFLTGLALFTGASLVSGLADSGTQLIAARAVQGLSAALLTPSALSLITTTYAGSQRKAALALWGVVGSLGVAAGVLVGGAITTWTNWQYIFWINVPVGLVALVVGQHIIAKESVTRPKVVDLDIPGAVTVIAGLATMVYALGGTATNGWWSVRTMTGLVASAVLLVAFLTLEQRAAKPLSPRTCGSCVPSCRARR